MSLFLNIQGNCYEASPENTIIFVGDTLIQGIYLDLDEEYLFLPDDVCDDYDSVLERLVEENVPVWDLQTYDPEEEPFLFIINAMCRLFARELECLNEEN